MKWLPVVALLVTPASWAKDGISLRQAVPQGYRDVAREHGVPPDILYALSLTESGRAISRNKLRPWPWTLNVEKKSYYYPTRRAAWQALTGFLEQGKVVDIGLAQVNWKWHKKRLIDPWRALEPYFNLRVGAQLLRERYDASGDWWTAIGHYHAPAPTPEARERAQRYRVRVGRHLRQLYPVHDTR
jgi:hypothetical protein